MAKTSIHIRPARVSSSEGHNLRLKHLDYVRPELSKDNESWCEVEDLPNHLANLRKLVKEKTGRRMQKSCEPIKEGVVVIKETTTMKELQELGKKLEQEFGIRCIQIHIHKDEGHDVTLAKIIADPEKYKGYGVGDFKRNCHAHMVFDWIDYETGKTRKLLGKKDFPRIQDLTAEILGMERGVSSDLQHLNSVQYKAEQESIAIEKLVKYAEKLEEKIETTERSAEEAIERLNNLQEDVSTSEERKVKLEQITEKLEGVLRLSEEHRQKNYTQIVQENTKRGIFSNSTDYEAVAEELVKQQQQGETVAIRNAFLQMKNAQNDRENAIKKRKEVEYKYKVLEKKFKDFQASVIDSLGGRFKHFWSDCKRFSQDLLMAIGLWQGETWVNQNKTEKYTADKDRCLLLINGETIDEREEKWQQKCQRAFDKALQRHPESWVRHWAGLIQQESKNGRDAQERKLKEFERTVNKGQNRGIRR